MSPARKPVGEGEKASEMPTRGTALLSVQACGGAPLPYARTMRVGEVTRQ